MSEHQCLCVPLIVKGEDKETWVRENETLF